MAASAWLGRAAREARTLSHGALALVPGVPSWPWWAWALGAAAGASVLLFATAGGAAPGEGGPGPTRPSGAPPLLLLGSSGPWVTYLQALLGAPQTGTFDAATDAAVRAYQTEKGLTVDGKVGGGTWGALGVEGYGTGGGGAPSGGGGSKPGGGGGTPKPGGGEVPTPTTGNPFGLSETIDAREGQILQRIAQGDYEHQWWPLTYSANGHTVKVFVSRRALALHDGTNKLIVNGSMRSAQKAADMLGASIPTTRVLDEIAKQATTVPMPGGAPPSRKWQGTGGDDTGSKTFRMYDQSNYLDKYVAGATGLVDGEGKDWVQTRRYWVPPAGNNTGDKPTHNHANFGWHYAPATSKSPGGMPVIQSIGMVHAPGFTDYSQLWRFVRNDIEIDGVAWTWADALADPTVSKYVQDEGGTIPSPRHPDL